MIFMPFAVTCAYIIYISYGRVCADVKTDSGKNAKNRRDRRGGGRKKERNADSRRHVGHTHIA